MLCIAKLNNIKNPNNNGWLFTNQKGIYNLARYSCNKQRRDTHLCDLCDSGYIELPKKNGNLNIRIPFIDNEGDEVLFISDFRELGYEYRLYCGEKFTRCNECEILIRKNKKNTLKYCKKCRSNTSQKTKKVVCVDCGKVFEVSSMNNQSCRCEDCYMVYRKQQKLKTQRERRSKQRNEVSTIKI